MNEFKLICFCVLMDHHGDGMEHAHPDYLMEKYSEMSRSSDERCFQMLDIRNQRRVREWCDKFGQPLKMYKPTYE